MLDYEVKSIGQVFRDSASSLGRPEATVAVLIRQCRGVVCGTVSSVWDSG